MLGVADPHFWLDPNNMMKIADKIKSKLISIDPANANFMKIVCCTKCKVANHRFEFS